MVDAVTAAHHKSYLDRRPHVPKKFTELLEEYKYNPSIRGDAQLKLLFSYITEMQINFQLKGPEGGPAPGAPKILLLCPELSLSERWTRASYNDCAMILY